MTPKEKSLNILEKINNGEILEESWQNCSKYAKQELKRKAYIVVDYIVEECSNWAGGSIDNEWDRKRFDYWKEVKEEINKL